MERACIRNWVCKTRSQFKWNRVLQTQFWNWVLNRVYYTRDVSFLNSFENVLPKKIVWKLMLFWKKSIKLIIVDRVNPRLPCQLSPTFLSFFLFFNVNLQIFFSLPITIYWLLNTIYCILTTAHYHMGRNRIFKKNCNTIS